MNDWLALEILFFFLLYPPRPAKVCDWKPCYQKYGLLKKLQQGHTRTKLESSEKVKAVQVEHVKVNLNSEKYKILILGTID